MPVLSLACHLPHNTPNIPSRYNNEQTTKQTKSINNSYIYISHVNVTQTVPDISPLMPMHQDPLLVSLIWYHPCDCSYLSTDGVTMFNRFPASRCPRRHVQWELCGTNFRENVANSWVSNYNGNNDRSVFLDVWTTKRHKVWNNSYLICRKWRL